MDFKQLDALLSTIKVDEITTEENTYSPLPDGYYLCEVVKAELKETKETHLPMVSLQFKNIQNGIDIKFDDNDESSFIELEKTNNRYQFVNFVLKDEASIKRFISNMLKFEGEEEGVPLLDKEYFLNSELLEGALKVLVGCRIVLNVSTSSNKDNSSSTWTNMLSWKRVKALDLPF